MARKTNQSSKTRPSSSKANAAGYATRLSRKAEKHSISDVYEYQPGKVKRSKVALQLDRDEASEFRHDSDDQEERTVVQPRLIGETSGDERFDSEEDEEIDSDEAFEESDEERFAGFSFPSKVCLESSFQTFRGRIFGTGRRRYLGVVSVRRRG